MIKIILFGIHHYDPLCRDRLICALQKVKESTFLYDCIAVEWKKEDAEAVIGQRGVFRDLCLQAFPSATVDDIGSLEKSLAFEADAFKGVFPALPIYWLDEDRVVSPPTIENYATDRLHMYTHHMGVEDFNISLLSRMLCDMGKVDYFPEIRDKNFFRIIEKAISEGHRHIMAIVGYYHTSVDIPDSFANLLSDAGYALEVINVSGL